MNAKQSTLTTEELKELITRRLDVMEFLDIIGFTLFDLVEVLEDEVDANFEELSAACE